MGWVEEGYGEIIMTHQLLKKLLLAHMLSVIQLCWLCVCVCVFSYSVLVIQKVTHFFSTVFK